MKAMQIVSFDGPASGLRYQEASTPDLTLDTLVPWGL